MPNRVNGSIDLARLGMLLILIGTLINGCLASLCYEYVPHGPGASGVVRGTFLADPDDIHADLIKLALSYPPFTPIDVSSWPYPYQKYALQNGYHSFDLTLHPPVDLTTWSEPPKKLPWQKWDDFKLVTDLAPQPGTVFSGLHQMPLMVLTGMASKEAVLNWGPRVTVLLFYAIVISGLALTCSLILQDWPSRLWAFVTLSSSIPFLTILNRGNQGAFVAGFSLIFFLFLVCKTKNYILAAILLVLAINFRPNSLALIPLLFCFGTRSFAGAMVIFAGAASLSLLSIYKLDQHLYPGYNISVMREALQYYYKMYVIGNYGDIGNNSALGAFKIIYHFLAHIHGPLHPHLITFANKVFLGIFAVLTIWSWILFGYKKLTRFEFAFICVAVYILATSVIATYHLVVFAVFPLLLCRDRDLRPFGGVDLIILFASVFLLTPKNYIVFHTINPEAVLNPLVLLTATLLILIQGSGLLSLPMRTVLLDEKAAGAAAGKA